MEHIIKFEQGYDCIKFTCRHGSERCVPGGGDSHGRYGLSIRFVSKSDAGAVQFLLYTNWLPQFATPSNIGTRKVDNWGNNVMPADLGYHSKIPHYEGQEPVDNACEFCGGQSCYYDGSGLNANDAMYALVNGGEDALWKFLDSYYQTVFNEGEYPKPAEYPMPVRKG